jgi:uncharacterized tellurite resistance protein B-like protein
VIFDTIRSFLRGQPVAEPESAAAGPDPVHVAACALLLDVAHADGEFSAPERTHLEAVLERHFSLPPDAGRALIALCEEERARAVDHFQFTRVLRENYDIGQKMVLAEIMWGLVLADGQIAEHEHYLTRKIANLLELEPGYLSTAKASAQRKMESRE